MRASKGKRRNGEALGLTAGTELRAFRTARNLSRHLFCLSFGRRSEQGAGVYALLSVGVGIEQRAWSFRPSGTHRTDHVLPSPSSTVSMFAFRPTVGQHPQHYPSMSSQNQGGESSEWTSSSTSYPLSQQPQHQQHYHLTAPEERRTGTAGSGSLDRILHSRGAGAFEDERVDPRSSQCPLQLLPLTLTWIDPLLISFRSQTLSHRPATWASSHPTRRPTTTRTPTLTRNVSRLCQEPSRETTNGLALPGVRLLHLLRTKGQHCPHRPRRQLAASSGDLLPPTSLPPPAPTRSHHGKVPPLRTLLPSRRRRQCTLCRH